MKKKIVKKTLAGLSIAGLATGITIMPQSAEAGCLGKGSCGSGSCGSRAGVQCKRSMTGAADCAINPVVKKNQVGTDKGVSQGKRKQKGKGSCGKGSCGK